MKFFERLFFAGAEIPSELQTREQINEKDKWDLTHIYANDDMWEADFRWVESHIAEYEKFEGKLASGSEILLKCLKFDDEMNIKLERLHLYAMLSKDTDMSVSKYHAMEDRVRSLYSRVTTASSFLRPEILSFPEEELLKAIHANNDLRIYEHAVSDLLRTKSHTLAKEQEEILALAGEITQTPYNTYSLFTNADMKFPVIKDGTGNEIEISHARFYAAMHSPDRQYRKEAFGSYLKPYLDYVNTLASLFNGNLKTNIFNAKARKYTSALEASLDRNNIPVSVYSNLINTANENLEPLHRWAKLKKKTLGLDELHPYDVYVSIFPFGDEKKYSFEESKQLLIEALKPLGDDYLASLQTAFEYRWIDVYETRSKRSGAYSSGTTFGVHPYVLLNWTYLLNDVFTLAHEMGHNMHSYYTGKTQPYPYANYSIFLAEVASTFNESLLLDYLIDKAENKNEKLFLLEKYLNNITATFYRQVMFAEFEKIVYEKTEGGEALTSDMLCDLYRGLYQKYWGADMVIDKEEEFTWARVPHFYYNFYVFQYATGFAASEVLSRKVKDDGKPVVDAYLDFLKAGNSDYSINILKKAGVDMNSPQPVIATTRKMSELLDEVETLLGI